MKNFGDQFKRTIFPFIHTFNTSSSSCPFNFRSFDGLLKPPFWTGNSRNVSFSTSTSVFPSLLPPAFLTKRLLCPRGEPISTESSASWPHCTKATNTIRRKRTDLRVAILQEFDWTDSWDGIPSSFYTQKWGISTTSFVHYSHGIISQNPSN